MSEHPIFATYSERLREFIDKRAAVSRQISSSVPEAEAEFNLLALDLFGLHYAHNPSFRALCEARKVFPMDVADWRDIPAVPAVAFKEMEMTLLCPGERTAVFCSSGTTGAERSRHFHSDASLAAYEASLLPWFQSHLLPDVRCRSPRFEFVALTPPPRLAPHSSLVHMFETIRRRFAPEQAMFVGETDGEDGWRVNYEEALHRLGAAEDERIPVVLLGTAFNFVHLLDELADSGVIPKLPTGSRVMETGGYKGRAREMLKDELHTFINARLRIPHEFIICEYGMSELSSQAYDRVAGERGDDQNERRIFRFPPWARVQVISPETAREVGDGQTGLVRVLDLANIASALAVQTEDLAIRHGEGFELIGRATEAEPRGCSLMSL